MGKLPFMGGMFISILVIPNWLAMNNILLLQMAFVAAIIFLFISGYTGNRTNAFMSLDNTIGDCKEETQSGSHACIMMKNYFYMHFY